MTYIVESVLHIGRIVHAIFNRVLVAGVDTTAAGYLTTNRVFKELVAERVDGVTRPIIYRNSATTELKQ